MSGVQAFPRLTRFKMDDSDRLGWLLAIWREDLIANRGYVFSPGFHVLAVYRFGVWSRQHDGFAGWLLDKMYTVGYLVVRMLYGAELPRFAVVGRRLSLPHPVGVIISGQAKIGDDCVIRQNVTVGQFTHQRHRRRPVAPTLGDGVSIGAGAVLVGGVKIGDGARIGPNAVVMKDVPAGGSAFARAAGVMTLPVTPKPPQDANERISQDPTNQKSEQRHAHADITPTESEALSDFIRFISEALDPEQEIQPQTPLISTGIADSFDVTTLLTVIEERYGVIISPEEVDVAWFDTPAQMFSRIEQGRS